MRVDGCSALITGASAGLGRDFARQLGGRAGMLVLVARRVDRLEELKAELAGRHTNLQVHVRATDLSKADETEALCSWLENQQLAIDLLINNAGLGDRGTFVTSKPERVMDMLAVNVTALTLLTRRLLPAMVARGAGAILNVSSSASFLPMREFAVYAATKAYVTSFSEALRMELRGSGVSVTALCPGPVHTEFDEVAFRAGEPPPTSAPEFTYVDSNEVVRAALNGVESDNAIVVPGAVMKIGMSLVRLAPIPLLRFVSRFAK